MLRKGKEVSFKAMNDFTGRPIILRGKIIGHAKEVRKMYPVECGEVVNPVYLMMRKDLFGNVYNHVIFPEELFFEDKFRQVKIMQAYKAKVRAEKERKRREYYFK